MFDDGTFIQAILANRTDNTVRLVYADWLDERGEAHRAEFLRLEVALATLKTTDPGRAAMRTQVRRLHERIDPRWVTLLDRPMAGWRIVRTKPLCKTPGKAIPAFIHNGSHFLSEVKVYADGAVDCWGFVDLDLFRRKLAQGWVVTQAPAGATLSMHNLGQAEVMEARWERSPEDVLQQVEEAVQELNPQMADLIDMRGSDVEVRDGARYAKLGLSDEKPYRLTIAGEEVIGAELPLFVPERDSLRLARWFIYADGQSQLGYATELMPLETICRMLESGQLTLSVPAGAWVTIDGLGRFRAGEGFWYVDPQERIREAHDEREMLCGGQGAIRRCVEAHHAYEDEPSETRRETLRQAYEAVPEHRRLYCGDMDSKDWPIRQILYGTSNENLTGAPSEAGACHSHSSPNA